MACGSQRVALASRPGSTTSSAEKGGDQAHAGVAKPDARHEPSTTDRNRIDPPNDADQTRVLFIGNSFTLQGPVPDLVARFARESGFFNVTIDFRAVSGQSLAWHRADTSAAGAPARLREGWDVVVLQDFSTRPTDSLGEPDDFKDDATWFYERAKEANPAARVVLFETWARRAGHPIYDVAFSSPAQMQAQLRRHYTDAAERYVPRFATVSPGEAVEVARVGDAWELQLGRDADLRLHGPDNYHASAAGQYLSAAVLFSTIFERPAKGLPAINVSSRTAVTLQTTADAVTGQGARLPEQKPNEPADPSFNAA